MKYKSNIEYYSIAEIISIEELERICRIFGINHNRLLNSIKGERDRKEFKDWKKLMEEKPGFEKEKI